MDELYDNSDIQDLLKDRRILSRRMAKIRDYKKVTGRTHELCYLIANAIEEIDALVNDLVPSSFTREYKNLVEA